MKDSAGSITRLIPGALARDDVAIQQLWQRYVARVRGVARPLVSGLPAGAGDEDDVAQSTFHAFFDAAAEGRASNLAGRDDLWRLLATIARRKATDKVRRELRERRGGGARHHDGDLPSLATSDPSPSAVAVAEEVFDQLQAALDETADPKLKQVAVLRLEGNSTSEIAEFLSCTQRTVQRKLHILERLWKNCNL